MTRVRSQHRGFSLIELVIVIVLAGIVGTVIGPIVLRPFQAYDDTSRRVALVDAAESALRQMSTEIRAAVPNTIRSDGSRIEFMPIITGGRYRYADQPNASNGLTPSAPDGSFRILGNMGSLPSGARLVVYNTGAAQFYSAAVSGTGGIITPSTTTISTGTVASEQSVTLSSDFQFDSVGNGSPRKRIFVTTTPTSYHCDLGAGTLTRYAGYAVQAALPSNEAAAPLLTAPFKSVVVDNVTSCSFQLSPGSATRSGLVIIDLTLTQDGEFIRLLHQVHVENVP